MDLVWAADPTLDTDRPTLMAGLIPKYYEIYIKLYIFKPITKSKIPHYLRKSKNNMKLNIKIISQPISCTYLIAFIISKVSLLYKHILINFDQFCTAELLTKLMLAYSLIAFYLGMSNMIIDTMILDLHNRYKPLMDHSVTFSFSSKFASIFSKE